MKKERKQTVLYSLTAVLVLLLLWLGASCILKMEKYPVDILFLGDSIIGSNRGGTSIPYYVATTLDCSAGNAAFGGSTLSKMERKNIKYYERDVLSLPSLTRAVVYDDFGPQQMLRLREHATEDFSVTIDELSGVDFNEVNILVLEYGTNDYNGMRVIDNSENLLDENTFKGALRYSLSLLQEKYPDLRIIIMSPTYLWFMDTLETCEERDYGYGTLEAYVEALREVSKEYQVEFIDLYHDFYPHETFEDWALYTSDGIHPNEEGRRKIADCLIAYLQE